MAGAAAVSLLDIFIFIISKNSSNTKAHIFSYSCATHQMATQLQLGSAEGYCILKPKLFIATAVLYLLMWESWFSLKWQLMETMDGWKNITLLSLET